MEVAVMTTEAVDMVDPETIMAAGKLFQRQIVTLTDWVQKVDRDAHNISCLN